jgi:hypothetical protein
MHMRFAEVSPPRSHPHVITMSIDPVELNGWQRRICESPELRLLDFDDSEPDLWTIRIGCASRAVASAVEEKWG